MVPRAALARRISASVAVRGVVPVARSHRRAARAHGRVGGGCVCQPGAGGGGRVSRPVLERLRTLLREEGGLIATLIAPVGDTDRANASELASSPARVAAEGPRTEGRRDEYELLVEAIYEGYLLHYGRPRVVRA